MTREDGLRFWHYYTRAGIVKQMWITTDKFDAWRAIQVKHGEKRKAEYLEKHGNRRKVKDPAKNTKEYIRAKARAYRAANMEHMRFLKNSWRERNRELARQRNKEYYLRYPEKRLANRNRRRVLEQTGRLVDNEPLMIGLYCVARRVSKCMGIKWHVDHITPLRRGGLHSRPNMQIIPATWNKKKGAKLNFKLPDCYISAA